ncbi:hypothetical protein CPAR01_15648 [Colletotrichum paranaense]|uniref:Uncharacterized protein n=1 Tax=Colletotrichum paranaense TaxID=1914294 RepID=A0ABQ9RYI8_9PEZI|nr:uncharacterized protein CPAR01_15648 [Colletotrichum paranaense]KAI3552426.1 hypothetical protein CSPX01_00175 [Colletotrichum filicis]KAK1519210.1 hypothetical protein CPAR01_15648 [Colletotrichum paranaense]
MRRQRRRDGVLPKPSPAGVGQGKVRSESVSHMLHSKNNGAGG